MLLEVVEDLRERVLPDDVVKMQVADSCRPRPDAAWSVTGGHDRPGQGPAVHPGTQASLGRGPGRAAGKHVDRELSRQVVHGREVPSDGGAAVAAWAAGL